MKYCFLRSQPTWPDKLRCIHRIYVERNKIDGSKYDSEGPEIPPAWSVLPEDFVVPPSGIKYCDGRWIFYNEQIRKSKNSRHENSDCPWLARSEEYDGFDLLGAGRNWELWTVSSPLMGRRSPSRSSSWDLTCNDRVPSGRQRSAW